MGASASSAGRPPEGNMRRITPARGCALRNGFGTMSAQLRCCELATVLWLAAATLVGISWNISRAADGPPSLYVPQGHVTLENFEPPVTKIEVSARAAGATPDKYITEFKMLPMRDGVRLFTVVIRPKDSNPHPTILDRTPYRIQTVGDYAQRAIEGEYVIVLQNERGSEWSEGEFHFLGKTTQDAQDTLTWLGTQPWSNGRAGAIGCSSSAENQLKLAARGHLILKAVIPMSSGAGVGRIPGVTSQGLFYRGGVPMISTWSLWYAPFGYKWRPKLPVGRSEDETVKDMRNFTVSSPDFFDASYNKALGQSVRLAPSHDILQRMNVPTTDFEKLMAGGPADPDWNNVDFITSADTGTTPALNINGWYDVGVYETIKLFEFQQNEPEQYLIMAPSAHCQMMHTDVNAKIGDRPIGDSRFAYLDVQMAWFDRWLKDHPTAWKPTPKVQTFLMGANTWLTGARWPLKQTRKGQLFLRGQGRANTLDGDGELQPAASGGDHIDHFAYDPNDPTPTVGGGMLGPVSTDQRSVERRHDVLVYSTPVLTKSLAIVGDIRAVLYVSADVNDADIAVKLVDVYPDGTAYNVQDSIFRLSHRNGVDRDEELTRGQVYRIEVGDMVTSNYFAAGHRVRIEIAGANFPNSDRNWNNGGRNDLATQGPVAHVDIHHGSQYPTHLEFTEYVGPIPQH